MPKISIVVPVYNAEKYLDRCMDSILNQTLTDYEVILVNDGSTDGSLNKCLSYAEKDSRIRVINKPNEGAGPTRTRGIEEATGEYLAFPDADDWFEPDMYEKLYDLAKANDADMIFSGINHYYHKNDGELYLHHQSVCKPVNFKTQDECRHGVMELFPTTTIFDVPWNKLYKRVVAVEYNITFPKLKRCQDAVFNLDFYNASQRVVSTTDVYYNYMENTQQDVWRKFPIDYKDIIIYYNRHLNETLQSWQVYNGDIQIHYDSSFVCAIYSVLIMCENPNWNLNKRKQKDYMMTILKDPYVMQRMQNLQIRSDVKKIRDIILSGKTVLVFRHMRWQKIMNYLHNNMVLRYLYHLINRNNK